MLQNFPRQILQSCVQIQACHFVSHAPVTPASMSTYMYVGLHAYLHMCGGQRLMFDAFCLQHFFLRQDLLLGLWAQQLVILAVVHMYMWPCVHIYTHACTGQRTTLGAILLFFIVMMSLTRLECSMKATMADQTTPHSPEMRGHRCYGFSIPAVIYPR